MNILRKMPFTGKHMTCTRNQTHRLKFLNREDAIEQADKFIEEIIEEYGDSGFFYYNYDVPESALYLFRFSVEINERVEYDGKGRGHILHDGVLSVYYDPGIAFSYVTVDYRRVLWNGKECGV